MKFLGLMMTELCAHPMFENSNRTDQGSPKSSGAKRSVSKDLVITGNANEEQTLEALKRYLHRQYFIQKALSHLFSLTHVSFLF